MKTWLDTYFGFSKREFNGLMVLVLLIVLVSALPSLYKLVIPLKEIDSAEQLLMRQLILPVERDAARVSDMYYPLSDDRSTDENATEKIKYRLFPFDPNVADSRDWQTLGLSVKQAASILKYVNKGGKFRKAEDLKKMYVIDPAMYNRLLPYVRIAEMNDKAGKNNFTRNTEVIPQSLKIIEVNQADSTALDEIKGIGPVFAIRILKYRERIGGFYKKEQLMEVFGLDSVMYREVMGQIAVNAAAIKRINVNTAQFEDFKNHPYIRYKQVNALIQYRKQHGNYGNIADLSKVAILNAETIARLAPYLTF